MDRQPLGLISNVHDELGAEVPFDRAVETQVWLKKCMIDGMQLFMPKCPVDAELKPLTLLPADW